MGKHNRVQARNYGAEVPLDREELNIHKEEMLWGTLHKRIRKDKFRTISLTIGKGTGLVLLLIASYLIMEHKLAKPNTDLSAFLDQVESQYRKDDFLRIGEQDFDHSWSVHSFEKKEYALKNGQILKLYKDTLQVIGVPKENDWLFVKVPSQKTLTLILNDGTKTVLNANSTLVFNANYTKGERRMALNGIGRFDIQHDNKRPMYLIAGKDTIHDIGTVFYVQHFNKGTTDLAVKSGVVDFQSFEVKQGERVAKVKGRYTKTLCDIDNLENTFLNTHEFIFSEESIDRIVRRIASWYGLQADIPSEGHFETYSGKIPNNLPLDDVLDMLKEISSEHITIVKEKGQKTILLTDKK